MTIRVLSFVLSCIAAGACAAELNDEYTLNSGDVLDISVWHQAELKREVLVLPDGKVSFPLAGTLDARGRTPQAVQEEIARRLRPYFADPVVTVSIKATLGNKVYVIGQVNKSGEFTVPHRLSVVQALSMAGGLTPYASEDDIVVIRHEAGAETSFPFSYGAITRGQSLDSNVMLKPGDVIVVPSARLF